jgi:hypothetical protein
MAGVLAASAWRMPRCSMVAVRKFPPEAEALAKSWRDRPETAGPWKPTGNPGAAGGQAQGYFVTSGPANAFAKPSQRDPSVPRAAHEKIAADLAFDLELPLPPAILHSWDDPPPVGTERFVALSLRPFLSVFPWRQVTAIPGLDAQFKLELRETASTLVAFDTWVDNRDRINDGNLLVSKIAADPTLPLQVAYIDYSFSMLYGWRTGNYRTVTPIGIYPTDQKDADVRSVEDGLDRIEKLPDQTVRDIVTRIDDSFLTPADRDLIVDGLLYRKSHVRASLRPIYGGIP